MIANLYMQGQLEITLSIQRWHICLRNFDCNTTPRFCPVHVKYPRLWSQYVLYLMRTVKNVHVYENWSNKYTDITHMGCIWKKCNIFITIAYIYDYNIGRFSSRSLLFNIYHCTSSYYIIGYLNRVERKCYVQNHI